MSALFEIIFGLQTNPTYIKTIAHVGGEKCLEIF
jgi:hypothetical protein